MTKLPDPALVMTTEGIQLRCECGALLTLESTIGHDDCSKCGRNWLILIRDAEKQRRNGETRA